MRRSCSTFRRDHPHTRGDHLADEYPAVFDEGSSPHAWGPLLGLLLVQRRQGIIPTRVGTTMRVWTLPTVTRDHPHTRGDHISARVVREGDEGSSPHAWGPHGGDDGLDGRHGIIPTRVGTTQGSRGEGPSVWDHPHTRGDHSFSAVTLSPSSGSSPHAWGPRERPERRGVPPGIISTRVGTTPARRAPGPTVRDHLHTRGDHPGSHSTQICSTGSSPHVRGPRPVPVDVHRLGRIIPACAGTTDCHQRTSVTVRDHPRMCGDHVASKEDSSLAKGSSPHVRGPLPGGVEVRFRLGIIPACAGTTPPRIPRGRAGRDHPRMCGDHLNSTNRSAAWAGSSPHVRGPPRLRPRAVARGGIIPACAGTTLPRSRTHTARRDHPRMCGDHFSMSWRGLHMRGSSPHVRGPPRRTPRPTRGP